MWASTESGGKGGWKSTGRGPCGGAGVAGADLGALRAKVWEPKASAGYSQFSEPSTRPES